MGLAKAQARERLAAPQQREAALALVQCCRVSWGGQRLGWDSGAVIRWTERRRIQKGGDLSSAELTFSSAAGSDWWVLSARCTAPAKTNRSLVGGR